MKWEKKSSTRYYESPYHQGYAYTIESMNDDSRIMFAFVASESFRYDLGVVTEHLLMEADFLRYGAITMDEFLWFTKRGFQERMDGHMLSLHREHIYQHFRYGNPLPSEVAREEIDILTYLQQ